LRVKISDAHGCVGIFDKETLKNGQQDAVQIASRGRKAINLNSGFACVMTDMSKIIPVILSGGGGTRLWPMSRPDRPKQFLSLTATQTMFQLTASRTADAARYAPPIIVANAAHADLVEAQLDELGIIPGALILEPCARNTAPAIALAALCAPTPDSVLLVMPSDHVIRDPEAFQRAIDAALPSVKNDWLATFGIEPTGPETGYGYIKTGDEITPGVRRVQQFVEKPDLLTAQSMIAGGDHVWNGGIFLFRADAYLSALAVFAPAILDAVRLSIDRAVRRGKQLLPDQASFARSPSDSIDYAVMERAENVAVAPVAMGWSDVGSWDALFDIGVRDDNGNGIIGDVIAFDTKNSLIRADGLKVSVIGLADVIVVASGDSVMIMPRGRSQDVKQIFEARAKDGST
jgi:mannose-1-phosphate guanylyltransferase